MDKAYEGKVVLVTGANSGIGEAAAQAFADAGATVFGVARRKETLEAARARHPRIRWLLADVSKFADVHTAVDAAVREAGRLDVLVNNAAIFQFGPLEAATEEHVRSQFDVNVLGATFAAHAALPALKASKGTIVNISQRGRPQSGRRRLGLRRHQGRARVAHAQSGRSSWRRSASASTPSRPAPPRRPASTRWACPPR